MLALVGSGLSVGAAGCSAFSDSSSNPKRDTRTSGDRDGRETETTTGDDEDETTETDAPEEIESPPGTYESVPISSGPSESTYAMMGSEDAPVKATVYGAWKCPHTEEFVFGFMGDIVEKYVVPGDVALEFRAVAYEDGEGFHGPDEPRAARAGLAVWNNDPKSYWNFFEYMFQNRSGIDGWATTETLIRIAEKAGVENLDAIRSEIESGTYQKQIEKTMERVRKVPISAVPRVVVDGEATAPTTRPKRTIAQLDAALGRGSETPDETTTTTSDGTTSTTSDGTTTTTDGTTTSDGTTTTTTTTTDGTTTSDDTTTTDATTTTSNSSTTTTSSR